MPRLLQVIVTSCLLLGTIVFGESNPKAFQDLNAERFRAQAILSQSPGDPQANFLNGIYTVLNLVESREIESLKEFAVLLGVDESIRNLVLSDFTGGLQDAYSLTINEDFQSEDLALWFERTLVPGLESASASFAQAESTQLIELTPDLTGTDQVITVDSADLQVLRTFVNILGAIASIQSAYDWNLKVGEVKALDDEFFLFENRGELLSSGLTLEKIRTLNENFGGIRNAAMLEKAENFLRTAIGSYSKASPVLRSSWRIGHGNRFFSLLPDELDDEAEFMEALSKLQSALDADYRIEDKPGSSDLLSLRSFFSGKVDFATLVPASNGNKFVTEEVSDPTFGGLLPSWTQSRVSDLFKGQDLIQPKETAVSYVLEQSLTGYEVQVMSSDTYKVVTGWGNPPAELPQGKPVLQSETYAYLVLISEYLTGDSATSISEGVEIIAGWNKVGWFGYFFAKFYPWVYHQNLGWIYVSEKSPDGTWFHFERLGWIWTNKDSFPSLYLHNRSEWSYLDLSRSQPTLYDYRYKTWFQANQPYVLSGNLIPANGGSVTGYGEFYRWETATLSASASEGYRFTGWGEDYLGDSAQASFEILGDTVVDASFVPVITPDSDPGKVITESFDLINNMKNLTPGQKERSMGELLIRGKSETSGISILPQGQ